jgi:hypothetical protein
MRSWSNTIASHTLHSYARSSWLNHSNYGWPRLSAIFIAHSVFTSVPDLKRTLMRYLRQYNMQLKSINWKYFDPSSRITPYSRVMTHYSTLAVVGHCNPNDDVCGRCCYARHASRSMHFRE